MRKYASDRSIDDTHSPGIRKALMDSGVSILTFLQVEWGVSLLMSLASTLGEAWGLGTGDCKTREIIHFTPFLLRSL